MSSSFRDLRVWRDAMKLASDTYRLTANFPKHELYALSQQMRRAAVSVPSNIAEGKGHHSNRGFASFLFTREVHDWIADTDRNCGGLEVPPRTRTLNFY